MDVKEGVELCIAYTDALRPRGRMMKHLWEGYHFWCKFVRSTGTRKVITATVVDGEVDKLALTYAEISERVHCVTAACCGYNVPDGSSSAEIEKRVFPMYCCSVCDRNNGLEATITACNGSLRAVDKYWIQ